MLSLRTYVMGPCIDGAHEDRRQFHAIERVHGLAKFTRDGIDIELCHGLFFVREEGRIRLIVLDWTVP